MEESLYKLRVRVKADLVSCKIKLNGCNIRIGDKVIFEESGEKKYGIAVSLPLPITKVGEAENLPLIVDFSFLHSEEALKKMEEAEKEILGICREKVQKYKLDMTFLKAEYSLDMAKVTVYFISNKRVDFRELVKDVNSLIKGKLELWQISSREKAFIVGGLGMCGREICCRLLGKIPETVSIRSVRDQGLEINPLKITGLCGKLMCCLTYEHTQYIEMAKNFPKEGSKVSVDGRIGLIKSNNLIKNTVTVQFEDLMELEFRREDVLVIND